MTAGPDPVFVAFVAISASVHPSDTASLFQQALGIFEIIAHNIHCSYHLMKHMRTHCPLRDYSDCS